MKPQAAVLKETGHIAIGTGILSLLMLLIFALLGRFDWTVLWGAIAGSAFAIGNFFALGMTVQKATANPDRAKTTLQSSYSARMVAMVVYILIGVKLPFINWIALAVPMVFPRVTIAAMNIYGIVQKKKKAPACQDGMSIEALEQDQHDENASVTDDNSNS